MAGCTRSRLRRLGVLAAFTTAGSAIALPPSAPPPVAASGAPATRAAEPRKAQGRHAMDKSAKEEKNPDTALVEYLGEYGDTADELDPMGLSGSDAAPTRSAGDEE